MTLPCLETWTLETRTSRQTIARSAEVPPVHEPKRRPRKAVVFVHGIVSDHTTFDDARTHMGGDPRFASVEFHYFDYSYKEPMDENGRHLAESLRSAGFREGDDVAVVAHSMGGLVTRFAILSTPLHFVRIVFLIGTPNGGAVRLSQLSALMQLVHGATDQFFAIFPRWSGIPSLSNAAKLIETKRQSFGNALDIDYISIPGCYFHQDRNVWDVGHHMSGVAFSAINAAFLKVLGIRLERPHDGIVEESSNSLIKCTRPTEKLDSYCGRRRGEPATYAHLTLAACNEVNHVQVHKQPEILATVCDLIAAKFGLEGIPRSGIEEWFSKIGRASRLKRGLGISLGG